MIFSQWCLHLSKVQFYLWLSLSCWIINKYLLVYSHNSDANVKHPYFVILCNLHRWDTLGVVGVVGVLVADDTNFEGPKVPNFMEKPPFSFASEQSRMSTLSVQKFWAKKLLIILRNSAKHIWPNWPNSEVPEKQKLGKWSCVIVLDTASHYILHISHSSWMYRGSRMLCNLCYATALYHLSWHLCRHFIEYLASCLPHNAL